MPGHVTHVGKGVQGECVCAVHGRLVQPYTPFGNHARSPPPPLQATLTVKPTPPPTTTKGTCLTSSKGVQGEGVCAVHGRHAQPHVCPSEPRSEPDPQTLPSRARASSRTRVDNWGDKWGRGMGRAHSATLPFPSLPFPPVPSPSHSHTPWRCRRQTCCQQLAATPGTARSLGCRATGRGGGRVGWCVCRVYARVCGGGGRTLTKRENQPM